MEEKDNQCREQVKTPRKYQLLSSETDRQTASMHHELEGTGELGR